MTQFIKCETPLPEFDPFPKYLWQFDISDTDKLIYIALLSRTTLSQKNRWTDENGNVYIIFEIKSIMKYVGKSRSTVFNSLRNLERHNLIVRQRTGYDRANHIFVKIVEGTNKTTLSSEKLDAIGLNYWNNKVQNPGKNGSNILHTNKNKINKHNINNIKSKNCKSISYSHQYNYTKGDGF